MKVYAHAKINLSLDVCGRRPDGYHEVRMVMQSLALSDEIVLTPREDGRILMTMEPAVEDIPTDGRNLMVRAARLMQDSCGIRQGVDMHLIKRIPSQAGLGGGSADAAAVLKGMNRLFGTDLSDEALQKLGLGLGADVPFCVMGGMALAEGIGDHLTEVLPHTVFDGMPVLLVKPARGISTGAMYAALDAHPDLQHPDTDACLDAIIRGDLVRFSESADNSFSLPVEREIPEIRKIIDDMRLCGSFFACMSGSGPTVFGLFRTEEALRNAEETIREAGYADQLSDIIHTSFETKKTDP